MYSNSSLVPSSETEHVATVPAAAVRNRKGLLAVAIVALLVVTSGFFWYTQSRGPAPNRTISNGTSDPTGVVIDPHGTLYVANADSKTVTVYRL